MSTQLPIEIALRIRTLLQRQHSALESADALVDTLSNSYDTIQTCVRIDEDVIKQCCDYQIGTCIDCDSR